MLTLSNACLVYQHKVIFNNLNLALPPQQWTCILGPSGTGKSSLLRLIAGLPIEGTASGDSNIPLETIAYMAQTDLLLPWLNVLDNMLIGYTLRREKITSPLKTKALKLLEKMGISKLAYQKPSKLSGGERQRVALARTLFEHKETILMDEPFSALDAVTRWKLQSLAADYLRNKTVLLVTHDPLEALRLGHVIYILSGSPALLGKPLVLSTPPLRSLQDSEVQKAHAELMEKLEEAHSCG